MSSKILEQLNPFSSVLSVIDDHDEYSHVCVTLIVYFSSGIFSVQEQTLVVERTMPRYAY